MPPTSKQDLGHSIGLKSVVIALGAAAILLVGIDGNACFAETQWLEFDTMEMR